MNILSSFKNLNDHQDLIYTSEDVNRLQIYSILYDGNFGKYAAANDGSLPGWITKDADKKKINMAKVVSEYMAQLIYSEKTNINVSDATAEEYINKVFKTARFDSRFTNKIENMVALSLMTAAPFWNGKEMSLRFTDAFSFLPNQSANEEITGGVFVTNIHKGHDFFHLLEWNEWLPDDTYRIRNELYKSASEGDLGKRVNLETLPEYADMPNESILNNLSTSLFYTFKSNLANNHDLQSPLSISIFDNAIDTMAMLNVMFDNFFREFKLGKKRVIVPSTMLRTFEDVDGIKRTYFDTDESVYEGLNMDPNVNKGVQDVTTEIRSEAFIESINAALQLFAMQIHLTTGTFTFDGGSAVKTATEVISENSETFKTRNRMALSVSEGLQHLIVATLELGVAVGDYSGPTDVEVTVDFDDSIAQDEDTVINRFTTAFNNKMIPQVRAIANAWNLPEDEAKRWVEEIKQENPDVIADSNPNDLFGDGE